MPAYFGPVAIRIFDIEGRKLSLAYSSIEGGAGGGVAAAGRQDSFRAFARPGCCPRSPVPCFTARLSRHPGKCLLDQLMRSALSPAPLATKPLLTCKSASDNWNSELLGEIR